MNLIRKPYRKFWHLHDYRGVDGVVYFLGIIEQCVKCHKVKVTWPITEQVAVGDHTMLEEIP